MLFFSLLSCEASLQPVYNLILPHFRIFPFYFLCLFLLSSHRTHDWKALRRLQSLLSCAFKAYPNPPSVEPAAKIDACYWQPTGTQTDNSWQDSWKLGCQSGLLFVNASLNCLQCFLKCGNGLTYPSSKTLILMFCGSLHHFLLLL